MAKSLCKYRRFEIGAQLGEITQLVAQPKFICRSCTRVAAERSVLCKPVKLDASAAATMKSVTVKPPVTEPATELTVKSVPHPKHEKKAGKAAKKALKKQKKALKKLAKLVKKSSKLAKKQQKLEQKYQYAADKANKRVASVATLTQLH